MTTPPPWTGFNFVPTLHHRVPANLTPSQQSLPSPFVVCVTGASRGIGAQTAKVFAQAGATGLILTARTTAALEQSRRDCVQSARHSDLKITMLAAEASSEQSALVIAMTAKDEHGRLDVLINNASIVSTDQSAFSDIQGIAPPQIEHTMAVNYTGRFLTIKHCLPVLLSSADGANTIINISSFSAHFSSMGAMGFNISELASNRLIEAVAEQYTGRGVMAHSVHPGMVLTTPPPGIPAHMSAYAEDHADLCGAFLLWLVMEKRGWLSGRYLSANWDVHELESRREEIVLSDKLKMRMVV